LKPQNKRAPRKVLLLNGRGPNKEDEYILQLQESQTREEATRLRGGTLFVREEERDVVVVEDLLKDDDTQPQQEEYFISDLVGLHVFLLSSGTQQPPNPFVGTVAGVVLAQDLCSIPGLGHDMLEINLPRGRGGTMSLRDELVLVPFVQQIVPLVSIAERAVYIDPPDGLLDLTYVREEKVRIKGFLPPSLT
jgi:16S rRNA processing protein RimM